MAAGPAKRLYPEGGGAGPGPARGVKPPPRFSQPFTMFLKPGSPRRLGSHQFTRHVRDIPKVILGFSSAEPGSQRGCGSVSFHVSTSTPEHVSVGGKSGLLRAEVFVWVVLHLSGKLDQVRFLRLRCVNLLADSSCSSWPGGESGACSGASDPAGSRLRALGAASNGSQLTWDPAALISQPDPEPRRPNPG